MQRIFLFSFVIFSLVIAKTFARFSFGKCALPPKISNFNTVQYAGKWYNIMNFPVSFQDGLSCVTATYGYINATSVTVQNYGIDLTTNKTSVINGTAKVPDPTYPNRLLVTFPISVNIFGIQVPVYTNVGNYDVWATDFNTYSLVYSCTDILGLARYEVAWILARQKQLSNATITMLYGVLSNGKVDPSAFVTCPQTCNN